MTGRLALAALLILAGAGRAQEATDDSVHIAPPDTISVPDTIPSDSPTADSLSQAERARLDFEKRRQQFQQEQQSRKRAAPFSFFDSLVVHFAGERLNRRGDVDQSYYHDAGDYFRLDPSHFVLNHQATPMRSTVQPFGLQGDRLNFIAFGYRLHPVSHLPEPDGLIDVNAISTALDEEILLLPGPIGHLFGGRSGVASLVTRPKRPADYDARSAFLADQGGFEYALVRGRLTKRFTDGRTVDAAVEYRNADGQTFGRNSDQYNYYGDFFFPLTGGLGFHAWGSLYDLSGPLQIRPDLGGAGVNRDQFNRQAQLSFTHDAEDGSRRFEIGYRHERHGAYNTSAGASFKNRLNWTNHGAFIGRDWMAGGAAVSLQAEGTRLEYDSGDNNIDRFDASASLRIADLSDGWRWGLSLGGSYAEDFPFQPAGSLTLFREGNGGMFMLSAGYVARAPDLNELYLPEELGLLYGGSEGYGEVGNADLDPERQIVGSVTIELGSPRTNLNISATGGRIIDGIEWRPAQVSSLLLQFSPINTDVDFASVTATPRIALGRFLSWRGGGSYHWIDYADIGNRAYTPEYQAFTGLELHVYWPQKGIDLYAYGELAYTGAYDGHQETGLGRDFAPNGKLSFAMGPSFRMNFVFQNVLSTEYRQREYFTLPGRFFYFGFEWDFLN